MKKCTIAARHDHETLEQAVNRSLRMAALFRDGARALEPADYLAVLPPPSPHGCPQNRERARVLGYLRTGGFWDARTGGVPKS